MYFIIYSNFEFTRVDIQICVLTTCTTTTTTLIKSINVCLLDYNRIQQKEFVLECRDCRVSQIVYYCVCCTIQTFSNSGRLIISQIYSNLTEIGGRQMVHIRQSHRGTPSRGKGRNQSGIPKGGAAGDGRRVNGRGHALSLRRVITKLVRSHISTGHWEQGGHQPTVLSHHN